MGSICQTGRATRGIATVIHHGRERHQHCADPLCSFSHTDRAFTYRVCEADGRLGTSVASLPNWLGLHVTGAGQIACGLGVLFSIFPRVAARAEAGMISLFTLLVWGPAILAAPRTRLPWTAFFISCAIASAAWVVAQNIAPKQPATPEV